MIRRPPRSTLFPYTDALPISIHDEPCGTITTSVWVGARSGAVARINTLPGLPARNVRSEEHTSELQSRLHLVCRLLLEKKNKHRFSLVLANHSRLTCAVHSVR